ncbi:Uncharacterised protein [Mycobacteroides abscessus subsp. abscessus]|nr:Uncharacterised protein [Mycobacteroides abscessus subsp. abscessus]
MSVSGLEGALSCQNAPMASEVMVALIGGGAGLVSGAIGSLLAPWSTWGVERNRLKRERRTQLIAEWREGVDNLRQIESDAVVEFPAPRIPGGPEGLRMLVDDGSPDPKEANVSRYHWYASLKPYLSSETAKVVDELAGTRIINRKKSLPVVLSDEIVNIEKKWKLV